MAENKIGLFKVLRIAMLVVLVGFLFLVTRQPASTQSPNDPAQTRSRAREFDAKLTELQTAQQNGTTGAEVRFDAEQVNAFIAAASAPPHGNAETREATPPIKSTDVSFHGDEVSAVAVVERFGRDIYITVSAKLGASGGYLTFTPTAFKIGDLSVPVSMVDPVLQKKLAEPENHEKLKLPDFIADIRVEGGQLVVVEK